MDPLHAALAQAWLDQVISTSDVHGMHRMHRFQRALEALKRNPRLLYTVSPSDPAAGKFGTSAPPAHRTPPVAERSQAAAR